MRVVAKINGRWEFSGTPKEVVLQMTRQDFICQAKSEYMREVAERLTIVYDTPIEFNDGDHEGFLRELERTDFVEIIND